MKKALVLLVLGLMMGLVGYGQGTFLRFYDVTSAKETFLDVAELDNNTYACVGLNNHNGGIAFTGLVVIYDSLGSKLITWGGQQTNLEDAFGVTKLAGGGYAIAGYSGNIYLASFNSDATENWIIDTLPPYNSGRLETLITDTDSSILAVGFVTDSLFYSAIAIKVDANGNVLWTYTYTDTSQSDFYDVIKTLDGGYILTGYNYISNNNVLVVKLNSVGQEIWRKSYDLNHTYDPFVKTVELPNSDILLSGTFDSFGISPPFFFGQASYLFKINSLGDSLQYKVVDIGNSGIQKMILGQDSTIVVTGYTKVGNTKQLMIAKVNLQLDTVWTRHYAQPDSNIIAYSIKNTHDGGYIIVGSWGNRAYLLKTDKLGIIPSYRVKGQVLKDGNANCLNDFGDIPLANHLVEVSFQSSFYGYSNQNGEYSITVFDTGQAVITSNPSSSYWASPACQGNSFNVTITANPLANLDIFAEALIDCIDLSVNLITPRLRRCFQSKYTANYCNNGTLPANSAYIEIEMDPYLTVDSASIPWVLPQSGNLYRFNVDTVGIGQCGSFNIWVTVDCDSTELGQTHCVSAHIYPDSICLPPDPAWDGSSVAVSGSCDVGDTLDLKIQNVGASDMTSPSFFLIAEDNVMYQSGNFQLQAGDSLKFRFKGNGSTFTLLADQVEGHPGNSFPMVSIEGCGVNNQGTFSKGFVTQYPQDDQNGYMDVLCLQNIGAYDPNDKRPEPLGLDNEGYITATQPLDYTIRFQNTGTDTAFTVIIRDTLSPYLDITTLYLTGASHPYSFQIIGSNVLEWTFANILLPDSNVNEPLSHGFVSFHIDQVDGNAVGTEITNRAGIYFDFNAVVLTNTTLNTIIADYKTWFTFVQSPESTLQLSINPNPNSGTFSLYFEAKPTSAYEFAIYNLVGAKQFGQTLTGNAPYVLQPDLPTGMYIYQLLENGTAVGMGKVVVNR